MLPNQTLVIDNHKQAGESGWVWDESVHLHKRLTDNKRKGASVIVHLNKVEVKYLPKNIAKKNKTMLRTELQSVFDSQQIRAQFIAEICTFWADVTNIPLPITSDKINSLEIPIKRIASAFGIKSSITEKLLEDSVAFFKLSNEQTIAFDAKNGKRLSIGNDKGLIKRFVKSRAKYNTKSNFELLDIKK